MSLAKLSFAGKIKIVSARESLVSDIPAGDGKTANLFLQCRKTGEGGSGVLRNGEGEKLWSGETKRL